MISILPEITVSVKIGNKEINKTKLVRGKGTPIHADLGGAEDASSPRLQDRYSIRCAPHVIGVLRDAHAARTS